ncbi:Hypothetical predicted protein [Olea europaea subsp. europaea]|uniref:Uncharacterized protein n=1 Tax=Olea europaea subsp. europaea TaxID=158383 RepID=A0A8S0UPC4_OLEEU|nr:Hypothetical predicted protein [Olea europaea subsp. europaea]
MTSRPVKKMIDMPPFGLKLREEGKKHAIHPLIHIQQEFRYLLSNDWCFSCLQISLTEARQLKPFKKQEKHDFPATLTANASAQIVGQKSIPPPTNQKHEIDSSDAMGVNDFRPTSPGKCPGIGHSFLAQKDNVAVKTDVFRPTGAGPSIGIGLFPGDVGRKSFTPIA